jgi:hypothetical protein
LGGSPYASHTPQTVVTVGQIMTAWRIAAFGAAASIKMMTSVRIGRPIIDTPSRMPDAKATTAEHEEAEDRDEQLRREQGHRQRRHATECQEQACDNSASTHNLAPGHRHD